MVADKMDAEMCKELGEFEVDLDGRFSSIRTMETNLGTFICDIMVAATNADFALLNSGTLRFYTHQSLCKPGTREYKHITRQFLKARARCSSSLCFFGDLTLAARDQLCNRKPEAALIAGFFFNTFMVAGVVGHYRFVEFWSQKT